RGGLVTPPLPKPRFILTDTLGRPFDFAAATKGYVTLLFFGYTYCPDQCPMHMANLSAALKKLQAGTADRVKSSSPQIRPAIHPKCCAAGSISLIGASSVLRELNKPSQRSSEWRAFPWRQNQDRRTATMR